MVCCAATNGISVRVDMANTSNTDSVSPRSEQTLILGNETPTLQFTERSDLEGKAGGLLPEHSGTVAKTCADFDDEEEGDDDVGVAFGKTLTESTAAPTESSPLGSEIEQEEPRQLLLLLSSRRVEATLRATVQLLEPAKVKKAKEDQDAKAKAKAFLSLRKVLKVLAEVHSLWKLRHLWAEQPEESWGLFLQGIENALLPSTGLKVQLVERQVLGY